MKNKKPIYVLIAVLIYVIFISFPTYLLVKDDITLRYIIEVVLRSAYLVFIILFSIFTKIAKSYNGKTRYVNMLLLAPLFFVAFFNLFYWEVVCRVGFGALKDQFEIIFKNTDQILRFICIIITVVEEELLFRYILQRNLNLGHKVVRIAVTAAIFTACHVFTMLYDGAGIIAPLQLIELVMVFGIGMILGFLYEYTNNIFYVIAFSFLYSLCAVLLPINITTSIGWPYYLTLGLFAAGSALYINIFYFFMLKKENR